MSTDLNKFGNPLYTGTWLDEGLNAKLASVSRGAHALVWERRVLAVCAHEKGPVSKAGVLAWKRQRIRIKDPHG